MVKKILGGIVIGMLLAGFFFLIFKTGLQPISGTPTGMFSRDSANSGIDAEGYASGSGTSAVTWTLPVNQLGGAKQNTAESYNKLISKIIDLRNAREKVAIAKLI